MRFLLLPGRRISGVGPKMKASTRLIKPFGRLGLDSALDMEPSSPRNRRRSNNMG